MAPSPKKWDLSRIARDLRARNGIWPRSEWEVVFKNFFVLRTMDPARKKRDFFRIEKWRAFFSQLKCWCCWLSKMRGTFYVNQGVRVLSFLRIEFVKTECLQPCVCVCECLLIEPMLFLKYILTPREKTNRKQPEDTSSSVGKSDEWSIFFSTGAPTRNPFCCHKKAICCHKEKPIFFWKSRFSLNWGIFFGTQNRSGCSLWHFG